MAATRTLAILLFDDVEVLDFCGPFEVFSVANRFTDPPAFNVLTVAEKAGPVLTRGGLGVNPHHRLLDCPQADLLVVPGGLGTRKEMHKPALIEWISERSRKAEMVLSVCTGALLLGKAGLLDGLKATTHHGAIELLRQTAPRTTVHDDCRFVDNGRIVCSAGIAAGIDMSLHVVAGLLGNDVAERTAKQMEYSPICASNFEAASAAHDRSFSPGEKKWTRLTAEDIDTAYKLPLIKEVYDEEIRLIQELADKESVLVEVGCGSGKFCLSQLGKFHTVVGVDISDPFLEFIRQTVPARDDLLLIKGDAANLTQVLNGDPGFQSRVGSRRRVVCCVLNTLGVMPIDIRQAVAAEMARTCGDGGRFFLTVFNARHFAHGLDELYRRILHLCGSIEESDIDWHTSDLRVASSGYSSHWFSKDELCALVENAGVKEYDIREGPGVGLYVVADCDKGR